MTPYPPRLHHDALPAWTTFAAAWRGLAVPDTRRPFRYLDLGCGEGLTACWVARLYPHAEVIGIDASPVHIARSRALAARMGVDVRFEVARFEDDVDLPEVDFAALIGVWSWVGEAGRGALVELLGRVLRPDGLLYVDGQALPGALEWLPLVRYVRRVAHDLPTLTAALDRLTASAPADGGGWLARNRPALLAMRARLDVDPGPVMHELLAAGWRADLLLDRVHDLAPAGLHFAGSAHLAQLQDPHDLDVLTRLDLARSADFRRDVFQRGGVRLAPEARLDHLLARYYALTGAPGDDPILQALDGPPCTGAALAGRLGLPPDELLAALAPRIGGGRIQPADRALFPAHIDDLLAAPAELVEVLSPAGVQVGFTREDRAIWLARGLADPVEGARARLAAEGVERSAEEVAAAMAAFDRTVMIRSGWEA